MRHPWETVQLGIGESDIDKFDFPSLGLTDAIRAFTEAGYVKEQHLPACLNNWILATLDGVVQ